jgi:hypothetical protein
MRPTAIVRSASSFSLKRAVAALKEPSRTAVAATLGHRFGPLKRRLFLHAEQSASLAPDLRERELFAPRALLW